MFRLRLHVPVCTCACPSAGSALYVCTYKDTVHAAAEASVGGEGDKARRLAHGGRDGTRCHVRVLLRLRERREISAANRPSRFFLCRVLRRHETALIGSGAVAIPLTNALAAATTTTTTPPATDPSCQTARTKGNLPETDNNATVSATITLPSAVPRTNAGPFERRARNL